MDKRGHTMIKNRLVAAGAAAALATGTALMAVPAHAATPAPAPCLLYPSDAAHDDEHVTPRV
ncbi:hypothetical protein B1B15_11055, partial [Cutibacterium acnes]